MAYSDFTLTKAKEAFALTLEESKRLFSDVKPVQPSELLTALLSEYISLATAINTEKARSELLIAPILTEVRRQLKYQISLFSGSEFNVDREQGLQVFFDFLISASKEQFEIVAPVVAIVEAKNDNIKDSLGQCAAEMVAARIFNQKAENERQQIYGAVTTGTNWRFLLLEGDVLFIDSLEYYIDRTDKILGILLAAIEV